MKTAMPVRPGENRERDPADAGAGMATRRSLLLLMTVAAPMLLSCGRSGHDRAVKGEATPATGELARPWVEDRLRTAIQARGTVEGHAWISAYWAPDGDRERYITVEELRPVFELIPVRGAGGSGSGEWKGRVTFHARRHRFADDLAGAGVSDWVEGAGPVAVMEVYLRRKKSGAVVWATSPAGSTPVEDRHFSPDEQDVVATALQNFQNPATPPDRRAAGRSILRVLREDTRILREVGGGVDKAVSVNARYVERAAAMDMTGCPPEFVDAYRIHLEAWRKGETALIESTWTPVAAIANQNGVGTFQ